MYRFILIVAVFLSTKAIAQLQAGMYKPDNRLEHGGLEIYPGNKFSFLDMRSDGCLLWGKYEGMWTLSGDTLTLQWQSEEMNDIDSSGKPVSLPGIRYAIQQRQFIVSGHQLSYIDPEEKDFFRNWGNFRLLKGNNKSTIHMNDADRFLELMRILNTWETGDAQKQAVLSIIDSFDDINYVWSERNLLRLLASQRTITAVDIPGIGYRQQDVPEKAAALKACLTRVVEQGGDLHAKLGLYKAPILFFAESPALFEHLCQLGLDPNERLRGSGFEGYPYFMLHHDFHIESYRTAKRFGFAIDHPIDEGKNLLHLFFSRFIEFDLAPLRELMQDLDRFKNIPDPVTGLTPLQAYVLGVECNEFSYPIISFMLESGFDKRAGTLQPAFAGDVEVPTDCTAYDLVKQKYTQYKPNEWVKKVLALLKL